MVATILSGNGNVAVNVHGVSRIEVSADSTINEEGKPLYWQELTFHNAEGVALGTVTLFLDEPEAALPVGDQPPYWGIDPTRPVMVVDEESPF
jgi:hypothetical protein